MTTRPQRPENHFVIVWEFYVSARKRRAFERVYGPHGDWVKLFRTADGYIRTELVRDLKSPNRFLTLDYWLSRREYETFRRKNRETYLAIDRNCEALTRREAEIGRFTTRP